MCCSLKQYNSIGLAQDATLQTHALLLGRHIQKTKNSSPRGAKSLVQKTLTHIDKPLVAKYIYAMALITSISPPKHILHCKRVSGKKSEYATVIH